LIITIRVAVILPKTSPKGLILIIKSTNQS
jgi:hypothetical protein